MFKEIQKLLGKNILRFNNNLKAYNQTPYRLNLSSWVEEFG